MATKKKKPNVRPLSPNEAAEVEDIKERLGKNLRVARKQAGLSQEQAAYALGVSVSGMGMAEAGRHGCSVVTVVRMARLYGYRPSELLEGL